MITKGHDVSGVTLVGALLADMSLNLPDFRSAERTFQILSQVAGRSGRGNDPGRVIIQTYGPEHYAIRPLINHDYKSFFAKEIEFRRALTVQNRSMCKRKPAQFSRISARSRAATQSTASTLRFSAPRRHRLRNYGIAIDGNSCSKATK